MREPVLNLDAAAFKTARGTAALEKFAAVTRLTVSIYGRDEGQMMAPVGPNPLFALFSRGRTLPLIDECVRRCLAQRDISALVVESGYGLAVVGVPLTNPNAVVCVAVAGYVLTRHLDQREIRRLAQENGLAFEPVWTVARKTLPIPESQLPLYGDLLRILGDTLVSENRRGRQIEDTLKRLEAADRSKDEFLATISHELRAPITTILGLSQMLGAGGHDAATSAQAIEAIGRNAATESRLIEDLLDISRIVTGKLRLEIVGIDLAQLIKTAVEAVRMDADAKDIQLQIEANAVVGLVLGDPDRVRQIFSNLLRNAIKFTPSGGRITVLLDRDSSMAKISVSDTGEGISADFMPHVFEKFRQADSTITRGHPGLGLGLTIVQHVVELHGGTVRADSPGKGQGATFTVTLPLANLPLELSAAPDPLAHLNLPTLRGSRVWVVDDDNDARNMMGWILEKCGAEVTAFASAAELLTRLDESSPHILVCDVAMPGMDGYTLMQQVRARGAQRGGNIPSVALTAYAAPEDRQKALSAGYQVHLPKPFDQDELVRVIARLADSEGTIASIRTDRMLNHD